LRRHPLLTNVGHGRRELADAAYEQANQLHFFPLWTFVHPAAVELAAKLASLAPGDLNRVFFGSGGGDAVETAWKLIKQYFRAIGQPERYKVSSSRTPPRSSASRKRSAIICSARSSRRGSSTSA
jgi:adenosylmethionine-8-amino-7-oxononanoate aminotransferase